MIKEAVRRLTEARHTGQATLAADINLLDLAAAYSVQEAVSLGCGWFGDAPARCWKSGGPSRDSVLTHAPLPPNGIWSSPAFAGASRFHLRGIEAEIALRLARDITPAQAMMFDEAQASACVDAMCVAIEIVDSRWIEALEAPPLAKLADLQSHGALVLGDWIPYTHRSWEDQVCNVQIGTHLLIERQGTHSLSDPAFVLPAWLRHATRGGQSLPAGTLVTTGTWVGILHAAAGDLVTVTFNGIGQASVQL